MTSWSWENLNLGREKPGQLRTQTHLPYLSILTTWIISFVSKAVWLLGHLRKGQGQGFLQCQLIWGDSASPLNSSVKMYWASSNRKFWLTLALKCRNSLFYETESRDAGGGVGPSIHIVIMSSSQEHWFFPSLHSTTPRSHFITSLGALGHKMGVTVTSRHNRERKKDGPISPCAFLVGMRTPS